MKKILFLSLLILSSYLAYPGGYQVRLQGQKQTGIALIGTPFTYGASSMFYNPGGLALVKDKYSFEVGASGILSNAIFQKDETNYKARTDNKMSTPFYAYFSAKIGSDLAVGIGVYTPFGSSAKWDENWAGRYLIQDISLQAICIQPTVAYQFNEKFGIGIGFVYTIGSVELNKALYYNENSSVNLKGDATSMGFNAGVLYKPVEGVSIGIDYRSKMSMKVENGDAIFNIPSSLTTTISESNKFSADLPLPANVDFGISYELSEKWLMAFEFNWVLWSAYDSLKFTFEENGDLLNSSEPREYTNSLIGRIGVQYTASEIITLRGGMYYDPSPTNENYFSPETVSLNQLAFTLGASITPVKGLSIDLSYLQLFGLEAEKYYEPANFGGTYKTLTFVPGIGISYNF